MSCAVFSLLNSISSTETIPAEVAPFSNENLHNFGAYLIQYNSNTYQNFIALLYYGYYLKNQEIVIAVMETLDGWEMFPNLSKQLTEKFGQIFHDEVMSGIELPPQGVHPKKKPAYVKKIVARIIDRLGSDKSIEFFKTGLRDPYPDSYIKSKQIYEQTGNIDDLLLFKHKSLVETLIKHYEENSLFFTQPVTSDVIKFVKNDQKISAGIREGNTIHMYKIPYLTHLVLSETDKKKRNYYVCHNPMIREALLDEEMPIDPIFCNCSGGFMKNYWDAVLGQPVDVELLDSVIMGGKYCKFAIHLPQGLGKKSEQ